MTLYFCAENLVILYLQNMLQLTNIKMVNFYCYKGELEL